MQLHFNWISESGKPGLKWQNIFKIHWPAYKSWLSTKEAGNTPSLKASQTALKRYMPEMWSTYTRLCQLAEADDLAARFLTGFQPPAYIRGCSQAVLVEDNIQLLRNYDHHPELTEGIQLLSSWNGTKVIANSDCLIGVLDGMNEDGLAVSLSFGGRKAIGEGFGIPFILRYVLEFCNDVEEAVVALSRIPSHMAYNVSLVDKTGNFKTVHLAPDRSIKITEVPFATNHQGNISWPENAEFNNTLTRYAKLEKLLLNKTANEIAEAFLKPPLYNHRFKEGFGTLYTVIYNPLEGKVQLRWPEESMVQTFENFQEVERLITLKEAKTIFNKL
jgi:predicted choloylglycine hydrolase